MRATAATSKAFHAKPYTVSVGIATGSDACSHCAASATSNPIFVLIFFKQIQISTANVQ
jgi:hypothetical protein